MNPNPHEDRQLAQNQSNKLKFKVSAKKKIISINRNTKTC